MNFITNFDWAVFGFFEKLWNPVLNVIVTVITYMGDSGIIWIALAVCLLIPQKTRKIGVYVAVSLAVCSLLNDVILKEVIQRPRPFNFTDWPKAFNYPNFVKKPSSWSFPSGHTASSFAAAFPLLLKSKKKYGIPAVVLAFLIGLSRIYVHVHYPTDVLAGIAVGIIAAVICTIITDKLIYGKLVPYFKAKKENEGKIL